MDDDDIRNRHRKDNGGDDNHSHIHRGGDNRYSSLENQSMGAFSSPAFIFTYTIDICGDGKK
jgi:hypothetical protein